MNRSELMESLREATNGDLWLTRYALLRLCSEVDLGCLINLVDDVLVASEGREEQPSFLRQVLSERWSLDK
jgi:hypothetical protein